MFSHTSRLISFAGSNRLAAGTPLDVARQTRRYQTAHHDASILVFDADSGRQVELDLRGSEEEVLHRIEQRWQQEAQGKSVPEATVRAGRGRPRLGVSSKEVTLLPRHWDWLANQPGGASVTLRKLVEEAIRANREPDRLRSRQEATYRFMLAMAGNEPGFEEAARALFASNVQALAEHCANWPADVRAHTLEMATRIEAVIPVASQGQSH